MDLPRTMTAAVTMRHGGPDATQIRTDWPVPTMGPGEVMVRVTAAALNNTDIWSREGAYGTADDPGAVVGWKGQPLEFPRIQGIDVAGVVVAVDDAVGAEWIGRRVLVDPALSYDGEFPDAVMGSEGDGGFAEYLVAAVDRVHDVSDSPLSDAQLACLPTAYGTALGMIDRADCAAGERVLVTGSAGGVGGAAIQLLVDRGCHVVARTSPGKAELVAAGGAHEVSVRGVDEIAATDEVDVVVDVVGGEEFGELLDRLRTGGRMVTAGAIAGPVVALDVRRLYLRQRRLFGSTMHTPDDVAELAQLASEGRIAPRVAEVLPLGELHEAQRRFLAKDFVGKLVVAPSDGQPRCTNQAST